jgi:hypothetical protein
MYSHPAPVWREEANFLFRADNDADDVTEQIWAKKEGHLRYRVCCIPFMIYDLALGDLVETDDHYLLKRVLERSGRWVFRAFIDNPSTDHVQFLADLRAVGALYENASPRLYSIDACDEQLAQKVADYLFVREGKGELVYETGKT